MAAMPAQIACRDDQGGLEPAIVSPRQSVEGLDRTAAVRSAVGPSRHLLRLLKSGCCWSGAGMIEIYEYAPLDGTSPVDRLRHFRRKALRATGSLAPEGPRPVILTPAKVNPVCEPTHPR